MVILRASYSNDSTLPIPPITKVDLDVFEAGTDILLYISAIENTDIGNLFGVSSQTFSLPGTDKNNQFFGNIFNLGAESNVALQKSVDCQVLNDGDEIFTGKLYIVDIITDQKGYTTYQVNIVNETVDFKFKLENTSICDLGISFESGSDLTLDYNYYFLSQSWSDNLLGGLVVFPFVEYGVPEGNEDLPYYQFGSTQASDRKIDNNQTPLTLDQFLPALQVRTMVNLLFDNLDYSYESNFFNSDYFRNIYFLATNDDELGPAGIDPIQSKFWAYSSFQQTSSLFTPLQINFTDEVYDNGNNFDTGTDLFTAPTDGYYDFEVKLEYEITNFQAYYGNVIDVSLTGGPTIASQQFINPPQQGIVTATFQQVYLTAGNVVGATVEWNSPQVTSPFSYITLFNTDENSTAFKCVGSPSFSPSGSISLNNQWPCEVTVLEFMQGLIEKFNLVIEPIPGERNKFKIEPFQDWVDLGETKDWTNKVDRSQRFKIVHPASEQPKTIYFRDADDESAPNVYTQRRRGDVFGTYIREELDSDLAQGERQIGKLFAATPVKGVSNTNMIIPTLATRDETGMLRPHKFAPRLLYKNGLKPVPQDATGFTVSTDDDCYEWKIDNNSGTLDLFYTYRDCDNNQQNATLGPLQTVNVCVKDGYTPVRTGGSTVFSTTQLGVCPTQQSGSFPGQIFVEDENGVVHPQTEYLQMTPFEYLPTDASGSITGSRDLHFGNLDNPGWYQYFQQQQNGKTTRDAYHEYWATYINSLYDIDARKLTCNVYLTPSDIADIRLNDKIFIDGHYYRINNISGANITKPASVEVELIKQLNRKLKYPRRRIDTTGEPVDITVGGFDASGKVEYIDFNSGATIDDYPTVSIAGRKDGFTVWADANDSASVSVIDQYKDNAIETVRSFGANTIDPTSENTLVVGSGNIIRRQSTDNVVLGSGNDIGAGTINSTIVGKNNTIEFNTTSSEGREITVFGDNVTVGGAVGNSFIISNDTGSVSIVTGSNFVALNPSLDIQAWDNDNVVIGNLRRQGNQYENYRVLEGGPGETYDLSNGESGYFHYHLTYTSSVNGTTIVYLPSASLDENKDIQFRFTTDDTLTASKLVSITPVGGELIDGGAEVSLTEPYDGVTAQNIEGEWIVIQAKA